MSIFIHNFIKRMTMREKAYFKRFAKLYSEKAEKNYLQLFEAIARMEHFDKALLYKHFEGQPIARHLSSELNYLLKQLLKSMANFYLESAMPMKLQQAILYTEILIERGFQKKALKFLIKAKKLAYKYEDFTTILKLIQLEEEILFRQGILGFTEKLEVLGQERELITSKINNLNQLRLLREQIREWQLFIEHKNNKNEITLFFENKLIKEEEGAKSLRAKEHWFYIRAMLYSYIDENEQALTIYEAGIDFLMEHNFIFKPTNVLVFISNYLYSCCELKSKKLFFKMYDRLLAYHSAQQFNPTYTGFIKYARSMELYHQIKDLNATAKLVPDFVKFMKEYSDKLEVLQKSYLYMILVRACIQSEKYELGLQHLNDIIQMGIRERLMPRSRLFLLMIYIQLDWIELAHSEIESAYKILVRHKKHNELTKTFIKYLKVYVKSPEKRVNTLEQLALKLEQLSLIPALSFEFAFFDYLEWVRMKQTSITS